MKRANELSNDELIILIAEDLGANRLENNVITFMSKEKARELVRSGEGCAYYTEHGMIGVDLLNYSKDLNAMHEAEKSLTDAEWVTYIAYLHHDVVVYPTKRAVCATARQRAEAYVIVRNLALL